MLQLLQQTSQDREYLNRMRTFGLPGLTDGYLLYIDTSDGLHIPVLVRRFPPVLRSAHPCTASRLEAFGVQSCMSMHTLQCFPRRPWKTRLADERNCAITLFGVVACASSPVPGTCAEANAPFALVQRQDGAAGAGAQPAGAGAAPPAQAPAQAGPQLPGPYPLDQAAAPQAAQLLTGDGHSPPAAFAPLALQFTLPGAAPPQPLATRLVPSETPAAIVFSPAGAAAARAQQPVPTAQPPAAAAQLPGAPATAALPPAQLPVVPATGAQPPAAAQQPAAGAQPPAAAAAQQPAGVAQAPVVATTLVPSLTPAAITTPQVRAAPPSLRQRVCLAFSRPPCCAGIECIR